MLRRKSLRIFMSTALTVCLALPLSSHIHAIPVAHAFTARNLMYGSQGYDVDELQNRLKYLGYYKGKVDGNFGWTTYWAVRSFQSKFGLKVDGRAGTKTKMMLVKATPGWSYQGTASPKTTSNVSPRTRSDQSGGQNSTPLPNVSGLSQSDLRLMQHVVYGEARGEPYEGEVAIAAVILNRLRDPRFPHNVPGIVYQPGAFTAVADGQVNLQPDAKAMRAVLDACHGWDPSHGAVYYFNPATATSAWIWSRPQILKIGKHIFCK